MKAQPEGQMICSPPSSSHPSRERTETKINLFTAIEAPRKDESYVSEYNSSLRHSDRDFTPMIKMRKIRGSWCTAARSYKGVSRACATQDSKATEYYPIQMASVLTSH